MARIAQSLANKKNEDSFPQNLLTRFHFMELVVRMSITKYTKQNEAWTPHECVRRFVMESLQPSLKSKQGKEASEAKAFLGETVFPDREVQKFLFLNQFGLKKIFDMLCLDLTEKRNQEAKEGDGSAGKLLKRKLSLRRRISVAKPP